MNSRQTNNFFIHSSLSGVSTTLLKQLQNTKTGYYQNLIYASLTRYASAGENIESVTGRLATIARQAYIARQMGVVEQASQLMLSLSRSEEIKGVGLFYQALCLKQRGDKENALRLLDQVAQGPSTQYTARSLQNIGAICYEKGEIGEALSFFLAAGKIASNCDLVTLAESQKMIAIVRSIYGDHKQAINDLEKLFPLVCSVSKHYPAIYYEHLNSLAVEFGEVGRIAEAQTAINIVVASPYTFVYPYWLETRDEIEQKRKHPDLSRCFIDRSLAEAEAIPDSNSNLSVEADAERASETRPVRTSTLCRFVGQSIYQRPVTLPKAIKATIPGGFAKSFLLQRLGRCLQPRAPPSI